MGYWKTTFSTGAVDDLSSHAGERRKLLLEVFYPAVREVSPKPYATAFIAASLSKDYSLPQGFADEIQAHAGNGASPVEGQFPVVIFSHGLSWPVTLYQTLLEDLSSRGYVVVAVNHPHGAAIDYGAGKTLGREAWPQTSDDTEREAMLASRVGSWTDDVRAVITELATWKNARSDNPVASHLDVDHLGVAGHSYGGTAVARLTDDPRVKAVVAMEGKVRNVDGAPVIVHAPFLHLISGYNRIELEGKGYVSSDGAPVFQAVIAGTGHAYFSDLIFIYRAYADAAWKQRHRFETDPARVIQITRDYLGAFFDRYLKEKDGGVLLRPVSYGDRVESPQAGGYHEVDLTISIH